MPQVGFSIDEQTHARLDHMAKKQHCSMAECARMIVQQIAKEDEILRIKPAVKGAVYQEAKGKIAAIPIDGFDILIGVVTIEVDKMPSVCPGENVYEQIVIENVGYFRSTRFSCQRSKVSQKTIMQMHVVEDGRFAN